MYLVLSAHKSFTGHFSDAAWTVVRLRKTLQASHQTQSLGNTSSQDRDAAAAQTSQQEAERIKALGASCSECEAQLNEVSWVLGLRMNNLSKKGILLR